MAFDSSRDFVQQLNRAGELKRISQPIATGLEITEGADREMKSSGGGTGSCPTGAGSGGRSRATGARVGTSHYGKRMRFTGSRVSVSARRSFNDVNRCALPSPKTTFPR